MLVGIVVGWDEVRGEGRRREERVSGIDGVGSILPSGSQCSL